MIRSRGTATQFIEQLKKRNKDFTVKMTSNSTEVIYNDMKFLYSISEFQKKHLGLFMKMKSRVTKSIKEKNMIVPKIQPAKYFDAAQFRPIELGEFLTYDNVLELDINKAYYKVLFNLGYIEEDFYNECINLPKKIRLALVGSLATQKSIFYYENGKLERHEVTKNDTLRNVFFQLVSEVDEVLTVFQKMAGENFIFYWVDGIYLKPYSNLDFNRKMLENKYNLDFSIEPINRVVVYNKDKHQTIIASQKVKGERIKTFNFPCVFYND
jgi:hypothetical protein